MAHIEPRPKARAVPLGQPIDWDAPHLIKLDVNSNLFPERSLQSVLRSRRSSRVFSEAPVEEVAKVVRETLRADFIGAGAKRGRMLKAAVSAGALHPVKCVFISASGRTPIYYEDASDRFLSVGVRNPEQLDAFLNKCQSVLPGAVGHWVALIADNRDLSRLYSNHRSLLWRDAGAVIQTMALITEAFELAFCPLGILGQELVEALLPHSSGFVGVGVVTVGRPEVLQKAS